MLDGNNATVIDSNETTARAHVGGGKKTWRELDLQLRGIARRRSALDVEEAACLIRARRASVHRRLGMGS